MIDKRARLIADVIRDILRAENVPVSNMLVNHIGKQAAKALTAREG